MTCLNNLFQIGVALNNYQSAHDMLPPGTTDKQGPIHNMPQGYQMSWLVPILPYLDEDVVFQHIDSLRRRLRREERRGPRDQDPGVHLPVGESRAGDQLPVSNYAGCQNDVEAPINIDNHGVLFLNSHISQKDVTDGIAHTIYVGEKLTDENDLGWMSGTRATLRNTGTPPSSGTLDLAAPNAGRDERSVGRRVRLRASRRLQFPVRRRPSRLDQQLHRHEGVSAAWQSRRRQSCRRTTRRETTIDESAWKTADNARHGFSIATRCC